jgi:hypothetical protein
MRCFDRMLITGIPDELAELITAGKQLQAAATPETTAAATTSIHTLLDADLTLESAAFGAQGSTALHSAAAAGCDKLIALLLARGAPAHHRVSDSHLAISDFSNRYRPLRHCYLVHLLLVTVLVSV